MSEIVPEGWQNLRLNEIAKIKRGTTYVSSELSEDGSSFPLYINMKSFKVGGGYNKFGDKFYTPKYKKEQVLNNNDILIANTDVTASCDILGAALCLPDDKLEKDVLFSHHVTALQLNSSACKLFIFYLLCLGKYRVEMQSYGRGTTVKMLDSNEFGTIALNLPPLPEQKKIASILNSVDDVIETTQKQIDKLQDLKKATMNELLTKGIGHTDFKDSELGRIPKSWEVKALGDYVKLQGGNAFPSSSFSENGVPVVRISNIVDGIVDMSKCIYFAESERFRNFVVCKGDILLAMSGATTGKVGVYWNNFESYLNQRVGRFKVLNKEKVAPLFLKHLVQSSIFSEATLRDAIGGAQPNISSSQVESVMYAFPPIGEQKLIASTLGAIDQQIEIKRQKLTQTQSLKKSLMQDLLTGKVRVEVD